MSNKKSLKAFVRFDGSGRVVAGSLILRKKKPKVGRWTEISARECCDANVQPIVTDPVVGTVAATTIDITWVAATVGTAPVVHYIVYLDTVQVGIIAAAATLAFQYTGLITATSYDLTIAAYDGTNTVTSSIVTQVTA